MGQTSAVMADEALPQRGEGGTASSGSSRRQRPPGSTPECAGAAAEGSLLLGCFSCSSRKGNGRKGPPIPKELRRSSTSSAASQAEKSSRRRPQHSDSDGEDCGDSDAPQIQQCMSFSPGLRRVSCHVRFQRLPSRHDIVEVGDEWREARKSADVDLTSLPSEGKAVKSRLTWDQTSAASKPSRQRAADRRKRRASDEILLSAPLRKEADIAADDEGGSIGDVRNVQSF
eukprot:TRINITY_DN102960_c0_g1_i1.p1 TRINITY_DN102960_c0_g1~~TRINITY_DN102960_c0_g1_i1.p1  ORF type:complete len:229 (+),score=54.62 TRINITY_DN102960_c0_g1_i1:107-793(+)